MRWCDTTSLAANALYIGVSRVSSEVVRSFFEKSLTEPQELCEACYMKRMLTLLSQLQFLPTGLQPYRIRHRGRLYLVVDEYRLLLDVLNDVVAKFAQVYTTF